MKKQRASAPVTYASRIHRYPHHQKGVRCRSFIVVLSSTLKNTTPFPFFFFSHGLKSGVPTIRETHQELNTQNSNLFLLLPNSILSTSFLCFFPSFFFFAGCQLSQHQNPAGPDVHDRGEHDKGYVPGVRTFPPNPPPPPGPGLCPRGISRRESSACTSRLWFA